MDNKTDLQVFKEVITRANITFKIENSAEFLDYDENDKVIRIPVTYLTIEEGYSGFGSCFSFDENGNLKKIEAYE